MPVPLPTPRVHLGFPPRATSAPRITAAGGPACCQGSPPYTEADDQTDPYTEVGGPTAPSGGPTAWGPFAAPAASPDMGPPPCA
jgi:hypothetical protein